MASVVHCLLLTCLISSNLSFDVTSKSDKEFLSLDFPTENHGVYGQKSLVKCLAKANQRENVAIKHVTWKKGGKILLMVHDGNLTNKTDGFRFADPDWKVNMNVSLLLTNTKMSDMGEYECMVFTDIGHQTAKTHLRVTAKYQTPTMGSFPGEVKKNTDVTLFCNATGGDQKGSIQWFDEFGTKWTRNSELVSIKTEHGLFNLSSSLVLKAPSSNYTCLVFNARGVQEGKASLSLRSSGRERVDKNTGDSHTRYVAPIVVIGSLIVGLLVTVLICKRRSKSDRNHPVPTEEDVFP